MKNIFKVNTLFLLYALVLIASGYINYLVIYLIILFFHELGHIITIKLFRYKITKITLYPYGGVIETNINLNIKSSHLFLISISGIIVQSLLLLIPFAYTYNYAIFKTLNISLICYNLLPIIPLDGYKVLLSINENIFKYRITYLISLIVSFLFLLIFFIITRNIIIFCILYFYNIAHILNYKYIYNKFLLERYLYKCNYPNKIIVNNLNDIYKCRKNIIKCDNIYREEELLLSKYFQSYYWQKSNYLVISIMFVSSITNRTEKVISRLFSP